MSIRSLEISKSTYHPVVDNHMLADAAGEVCRKPDVEEARRNRRNRRNRQPEGERRRSQEEEVVGSLELASRRVEGEVAVRDNSLQVKKRKERLLKVRTS